MDVEVFARKNTKPQMIKICREKGLPITGTKHDLAMRILGKRDQPAEAFPRIVLRIAKNEHGNYCHNESKLVFDTSKKVIGVQLPNGELRDLRRSDIDLCLRYKFRHVMPVRLDPGELAREEIPPGSDAESDDDDDAEE
jgi:hypothetical protein